MLAALAVTGCGGGGDERAATTPAPKPSGTPFPAVTFGELVPGVEYTTQKFQPAIRLTLPEGTWETPSGDTADHVEIEPETTPPVQEAGFAFHHMKQVFPAEEGGEIPGDAVDGPEDFAEWLTSHPHLKATKPEPVVALGLKGVSIDVTVKSSQPRKYKDCSKYEGDCVVMFPGGFEPLVYGSQTYGRFYVLEQPGGGQLVVEQFVEPRKQFERQAKLFDEALATASLAG